MSSNQGKFSTIRTLVTRNAMLYSDRIAMIEVEGNRIFTYNILRDRVNRMGNALCRFGGRTYEIEDRRLLPALWGLFRDLSGSF